MTQGKGAQPIRTAEALLVADQQLTGHTAATLGAMNRSKAADLRRRRFYLRATLILMVAGIALLSMLLGIIMRLDA